MKYRNKRNNEVKTLDAWKRELARMNRYFYPATLWEEYQEIMQLVLGVDAVNLLAVYIMRTGCGPRQVGSGYLCHSLDLKFLIYVHNVRTIPALTHVL